MKHRKVNQKVNDIFIVITAVLILGVMALLFSYRLIKTYEVTMYSENNELVFYDIENNYNLADKDTYVFSDMSGKKYTLQLIERKPYINTEAGIIYRNILSSQSTELSEGVYYYFESSLLVEMVLNI